MGSSWGSGTERLDSDEEHEDEDVRETASTLLEGKEVPGLRLSLILLSSQITTSVSWYNE